MSRNQIRMLYFEKKLTLFHESILRITIKLGLLPLIDIWITENNFAKILARENKQFFSCYCWFAHKLCYNIFSFRDDDDAMHTQNDGTEYQLTQNL
jgi:hypothetical protein